MSGRIVDPVEERRKLIAEIQARPEWKKEAAERAAAFNLREFTSTAKMFIEAVGWHEANAVWRKLAAKHADIARQTKAEAAALLRAQKKNARKGREHPEWKLSPEEQKIMHKLAHGDEVAP